MRGCYPIPRLATGSFDCAAFCDILFDSRTTLNYAQVQADAFNPHINQALPSSVQQNDYTRRPRTVGITAPLRL